MQEEEMDVLETSPRRPSKRVLAAGGAVAVALILGGGAVALAAAPSSSAPSGAPSSGSSSATPSTKPTDGSQLPARQPHLAGTVTSASSGKILIKDFDGFTRTINVSASTTYSDGLTAAVAAGTAIVAEGTVNADGVSLDATKVAKMAANGRGGPGGPGGRPGGHGPGNGNGSSSSSGSTSTPSAKPSAAPSS